MLYMDNHTIHCLQGCQALSWLSGLGSPIFGMKKMGRGMEMIPMKACESCWEPYAPKTGNQKYCSEKCVRKERNLKAAIIREEALIDGTGDRYLKLRFTILRRDTFTCQYCGRNAQNGAILHIDHIKPKTKGGELKIENLVTSCLECNLGKRDVLLSKREQKKLKSKIGVLCPSNNLLEP